MTDVTVHRVILPVHNLLGCFDESDIFRLQSYSIKLDTIVQHLLDMSLKSSIDSVSTTCEEVNALMNWSTVQVCYSLSASISPLRLDYIAVCQIYARVVGNMYLLLQEILFSITLPYRLLNEVYFKVTNARFISDGLYFDYTIDYIPF